MKVDVKNVDEIKRELKFEIPKDRVSKQLDEVYKDLGKKAKVKGFRPGKVPRNVLEGSHSHIAQEEAVKQLIPEVYHEGIKQENLSPIDMPDIQDVDFKDGKVTFTAKLEIKPEIKLKSYKQIKVKRKSNTVTDEEIEKTLDYIKQGQGADKKVVVDDAFAKGLGYPNLDEFKKSVARQMELDKDRQNRADVENQIVESLLKSVSFKAPESMMKKQLEHRIHETKQRLEQQGTPADKIKEDETRMRDELKEAVEKDVKVYLIFDKIAGEEKLEIKEGENLPSKVMELLLKEAKWEE